MKVAIIGAGAVGSLFGAYMTGGGLDVTFVERDDGRVKLLKREGLNITGKRGELSVAPQITTRADDLRRVDVVFVCVKSYHTRQAIRDHRCLVRENTMLVSLQNGVGNIEILMEEAGDAHVLGASTTMGAYLDEGGIVHHTGEGDTYIGDPKGPNPKVEQLAEALSESGLSFLPSGDINGILFTKLAVNCAINPLTALIRVPNGEVAAQATLQNLARTAVKEVVAIARAKGMALDDDQIFERALEVARMTANNRSSMLKDVLDNRHTEIDAICAAVVRMGKEHGIETPVNCCLADLITALQETSEMRVR